jgi:subtilisin family serine protease
LKIQIGFRHAALFAVILSVSLAGARPATASTTTQVLAFTSSSELPPPQRVAKYPKLNAQLFAVSVAAEGPGGVAEGVRVARENNLGLSNEMVRVVVTATRDRSEARAAISTIAGWVEAEYANQVQAYVPIRSLRALADRAAVSYVAPPTVPIADALTDEAVVATNASVWQEAGVTGSGVKVGIIDLGFAGYTTAQTNGDLPASLTTQDYCGGTMGSPEPHGTAVAGIVYKMAPGAQFYLICVNSTVTLGNAKDYALAQGITIVNFSAGVFNAGRGDGSGSVGSPDAIVADARAHGILWVNSAGNSGQRHWSGSFIDPNGNLWHDFASGDELDDIAIVAGSGTCVFLKWDSWPTTTQDFDLYLFKLTDLLNPVARSENFQTGSQPPTEALCYTNTTGISQTFGIAIRRFAATALPRFDLFVDSGAPQYVVSAGSITEPASSPSAMAVGAICFSTNAMEPYTSQGPTIDGRIKPDIAGQDATSSPVYGAGGCAGPGGSGSGGFTGTSASAPHVAGAAALVSQANPGFTPTQIQSFLEGRAVDLGVAAKDNQYGSGKLWLGNAPSLATLAASPSSVAAGTDVTATWAGIATPTSKDWVGVWAVGQPDTDVTRIAVKYTGGAAAGTVTLTIPGSTAPGSYEIRLFANDSWTRLASATFDVTGP